MSIASYFDSVLRAAMTDICGRIRVAVDEQCPHKVDTVLWYEPMGDGDPTGLGVFGSDVGDAGWGASVCDGMRRAGEQASEQNVVVVAMSATVSHGDGVGARVYAASLTGDMLVQDGTAYINEDGAIYALRWSGEPRRATVGTGQPFIRAFWEGYESAVAKRN